MKKRMLSVLLAMALLFTSTDAAAFTVNAASTETAIHESSTSQDTSQTNAAEAAEETDRKSVV